jgi:Tetracyclin repressor-like, C-terminal domain
VLAHEGAADLVLIDQVDAGLELDPDPATDWTEQLAAISRDVRAHLLAHPAVVPFTIQQPGLGPNGLRLGEFPHTVSLALLLARISTDDQFELGIGTFIAGLEARQGQG